MAKKSVRPSIKKLTPAQMKRAGATFRRLRKTLEKLSGGDDEIFAAFTRAIAGQLRQDVKVRRGVAAAEETPVTSTDESTDVASESAAEIDAASPEMNEAPPPLLARISWEDVFADPAAPPQPEFSAPVRAVDPLVPASPRPLRDAPRVFNIPPDQSFIDSLARGLVARTRSNPVNLSDFLVLVPDHETGSILKQALLREQGGKTVFLPRIDTPGHADEEDLDLRLSGTGLLSRMLMDLPPAVSPLDRQLMLAQEILKAPEMASSVQKAVKLGGELGKFIDMLQKSDIVLKDVEKLAPEIFRPQWKRTAEFLKIITDVWPKRLEKMGKIDPEDHRRARIRLETEHWRQNPPQSPVLAAGFTDTSPAVLELLQVVARLPQGAVVMPALDQDIDNKSWDVLTPVHPQDALKKELLAIGAARADVLPWEKAVLGDDAPAPDAGADDLTPPRTAEIVRERQQVLREAMRPSGTADEWSRLKDKKSARKSANDNKKDSGTDSFIDRKGLSGMELITCDTPQKEAGVIVLKLRETLETPGRTAMVVTADRALARHVAAGLRQYGVMVEDSAGVTLAETAAGVYLLGAAQMAADEWAPVSLLSLLKQPLSLLGEELSAFRDHVQKLEDMRGVLRGPRPAPGAEGIRDALAVSFNKVSRRASSPEEAQAFENDEKVMNAFIDRIEQAGKAFFEKARSKTPAPFAEMLDDHIRFAETLASSDKMRGADRLWSGDDGVSASRFLTALRSSAEHMPPMTGRDYLDVVHGLMREVSVRSTAQNHPVISILTPEQARLRKADVVIMAGVNDESWPRKPRENPWLSPDMIRDLGLSVQEESLGQAAHQFVQLACNPTLLMTRAVRSGSAPTVASPFLTRLQLVLRGVDMEDALEGKSRLSQIYDALHAPASVTPYPAPEPRPPLAARPSQLPVTAIEALMRDPYTVYAKNILNLREREPIDASPGASEKGIFIHAALDAFVKLHPDKLPDNAYDVLIDIGKDTFKSRMNNPTVESFWWPRFERIASWFVKMENNRREVAKTLGTEVRGRMEIDLGDGKKFTLTCIADRVDCDADNNLYLIDYKTGSPPTKKAVEQGFSPQLTLEALIAQSGGFSGIEGGGVGDLEYWRLSGGRPAGEMISVVGKDLDKMLEEARDGIDRLVKFFNNAATPYLPEPDPDVAPRYQRYAHLSRKDEWATVKKIEASRKAPARKSQQKKKTAKKPGKPGKQAGGAAP